MGRKVNRAELAEFFGISLPTLDKWIRAGMPGKQDGVGKGGRWSFDTAEVSRWREQRVVAEAVGDGPKDEDALKVRKLAAITEREELALAKERGLVAPIAEFERAQAKVNAVVRQNVMSVPNRVALRLVGSTEARIREVLSEELADALTRSATQALNFDDDEEDDA